MGRGSRTSWRVRRRGQRAEREGPGRRAERGTRVGEEPYRKGSGTRGGSGAEGLGSPGGRAGQFPPRSRART